MGVGVGVGVGSPSLPHANPDTNITPRSNTTAVLAIFIGYLHSIAVMSILRGYLFVNLYSLGRAGPQVVDDESGA